jgi:hypothetical protein
MLDENDKQTVYKVLEEECNEIRQEILCLAVMAFG